MIKIPFVVLAVVALMQWRNTIVYNFRYQILIEDTSYNMTNLNRPRRDRLAAMPSYNRMLFMVWVWNFNRFEKVGAS